MSSKAWWPFLQINKLKPENLKDLSFSKARILKFSDEKKIIEIAFDEALLKNKLKNAILKVSNWSELEIKLIGNEPLAKSAKVDNFLNKSEDISDITFEDDLCFKGRCKIPCFHPDLSYSTAYQIRWIECRIKNPELVLSYENQLANLFDAIKQVDIPTVKNFIDQGIDLNYPLLRMNLDFITTDYALIRAAKTGNLELVRLLVENGAGVNVQSNWDGETPLICCFDCNDDKKITQIAHYLINKGADINAIGGWCQSALMRAVHRDNREMVKFLASWGANINIEVDIDENECRSRPIHQAIYQKNTALTELLISLGASLDLEDSLCSVPLHTAVEEGSQEICSLLLNHGADINRLNYMGDTPLYYAVLKGNITMADFLLKHGAKINFSEKTPLLHIAINYGDVKMAKFLLDNGADRSAKNWKGETPLDVALKQTNSTLIELLSKSLGSEL